MGLCLRFGTPFYLSATPQFDMWRFIGYTAGLIYSLLIVSGGRLQSRVATSLLFPPPIEEQRRLEYRVGLLRFVGWTLTLMPLGPLAGIYFLAAALFGGTIRVQQESLLLILSVAMRTQTPLAEECEVLADASRGRFRRRLRELANRLRRGDRLSEALARFPGPRRRKQSPRFGSPKIGKCRRDR